ncbi:MAG: helix-turn-helix domain-containing protein, partial [Dehalococcoidia bacterium]
MATKLLVDCDQDAASLGIPRSKLYELLASGELRSVKIGKARRIPVDALQEFVQRLSEGDEPPL